MGKLNQIQLWIAVATSVTAFLFWKGVAGEGQKESDFFFIMVALFIVELCLFIFLNFKKYFVSFVLLALSINNLMDELFFDPLKLQLNELVYFIIVLIIGGYIYHKAGFLRSDERPG